MKKKMKGRLLAILMSLAMVFTMMPMMGQTAYADESGQKSGTITLSGDVNDLQDQTITFKRLHDSIIDPSKIIKTNFTNSGDYTWSIAKAEPTATTVMLSKNGTEETEFHDLTKNDAIKITGCEGSEGLFLLVRGDGFEREIAIQVHVEEALPSLGDDETIEIKVGEEKTIGDMSQVTDEDGNSYILHEYNYQVSDYAKDIVSITNMTEEGIPAVSDDYVTALKVTGKKPGKVVVEVTLCNNDRVPIMVVDSVKPMITKKYTITVLGEEQPDSKPEEAKVNGTLLTKATAKGKDSIGLSWNKIQGADGYDIFFAQCNHHGKKIVCNNVKTIKGNKTFKWTKSGLKKGTAYKAYVKAYVMKNGKKTYVRTSPMMHAYTGNGTKKYTNAKSVTVKKTKVSLKKGKTYKIKAKVKKIKKNKKLMPKGHAPKLRYLTSDISVATVNAKGKIIAKGKGSCVIYVFAHNGAAKQVKVTVN